MESTTPTGSGSPQQLSEDQKQLLEAVKAGNVELMETLLNIPEVKADYVYLMKGTWARTCLHVACCTPSPRSGEAVTLLLGKVNPNVKHSREQPIHHAAQYGNHLALKVLLRDERTRVNDADYSGRTALHRAAARFHVNPETYGICLEILLKCPDVDVNIPDCENCTAIREAVKFSGREAVVKMLELRPEGFDLDRHLYRGETDRDVILKCFPDLEQMLPPAKVVTPETDPQELLLTSLFGDDRPVFLRLLQLVDQDGTPIVDPNYFYKKPYWTSCVYEACAYRDKFWNLSALLRANANPNLVNPITGEAPIHVAIAHKNLSAVKKLLEQPALNINVTDKHGDTPLHYAVKFINNENEAIDILELLLNKDADVDVKNNEGMTAIMAAADLEKEMLVKAMLTKSDIDKEVLDGVTLRFFLQTHLPNLGDVINVDRGNADLRNTLKRKLLIFLYAENCDQFVKELQKSTMGGQEMEKLLNEDDGKNTFLQTACSLSNSNEIVKVLLKRGIDPNLISQANNSPPLVIAAEKRNYDGVKILLDVAPDKLDVNKKDMKGNTALHVVVKNRNLEIVVMLLNSGARMDIKNNLGKEPITTAAMKDLMDMSLQVDQNVFPDEENYRIKLSFGLFIQREDQGPHPAPAPAAAQPSASAATSSERDVELSLLGDSSRAANVHRGHAEGQTEAARLCYITETHSKDCILKHPLVKSFILLKWPKLEKYYIANLVCVSFFTLFVNTFIIMRCNENGECSETASNSLMVLTAIFWAGIVFRELLQLITAFHNYWRNLENYLDVSLIVNSACSVFPKWDHEDVRLTLSVVTVLLSLLELFVVIGRMPFLSKYMEILKTVTKNFFYFLIWYLIMLLSFGFCFYLLLRANNDSFSNVWLALFNIFPMMIGELNMDDIKFKSVPWLSYLLFVAFIFFVSIVLVNLLNGLAISDIQKIKESASLLSIRSHVRLIKDIEHSLVNIYKRKIPLVSWWFSLEPKKIMIFNDENSFYIYPNTNSYELNGQIHTVDQSVLLETMKIIGHKSVTMSDSSKSGTQITAKSAIQKIEKILQELQMDAARNTTSDT